MNANGNTVNGDDRKGAVKSREQLIDLLGKIRKKSEDLTSALWSQEELMQTQYNVTRFHQTMKTMMSHIPNNLYWYQKIGWKKFVPDQETIVDQERKEAIQEEKKRLAEWMEDQFTLSGFYLAFKHQIDQRKLSEKLSIHGFLELKQAHVLDIGCGDGHWLRKFVDWGALPEKLTGTEFSQPLLDLAKQSSAPAIQWLETYPDELPVEDRKFDIIVIFGVLMHILDEFMLKKTGQELLRVLCDEGIIIAANLHKDAEKELEPFLAYTTKGLGLAELMEVFPDCEIEFEELPQYGLAVISKKMKGKESHANGK